MLVREGYAGGVTIETVHQIHMQLVSAMHAILGVKLHVLWLPYKSRMALKAVDTIGYYSK